ncbi:hypothetical protein I7I48_03158 [Histoplasma ohiense]|nr:hypothetical protein I7I48_03158 [Histoplasma ohiense (nom. inval.)]
MASSHSLHNCSISFSILQSQYTSAHSCNNSSSMAPLSLTSSFFSSSSRATNDTCFFFAESDDSAAWLSSTLTAHFFLFPFLFSFSSAAAGPVDC